MALEDSDQPFTLGVRLDVDFDGFFRREDAADQLRLWREAIATRVLGLESPHQLQLRRVRRGSLDLEFEVEVGSGISDAELQRRLNQEADRLRALFQEPLLEVRVGAEPASSRGSGRASSPRAAVTEGLEHAPLISPSPKPGILRRPSPREEQARRIMEDRMRAAESSYGWDTPEAPLSFRQLQERLRAAENEYGLHLPLEERFAQADESARRFLERPQSAGRSKERATSAAEFHRFNHPTVPAEGPRFLMGDSYWEQRQGERIREQREALIRRGLLREEPEAEVLKESCP